MASIVSKNDRVYVVYNYINEKGIRKQKWEACKNKAAATLRKKEIEYKQEIGTFTVPVCKTLDELLKEYVDLYGRAKWSMSTYQGNTSLIHNYISPIIGEMKLSDITPRVIEKYYQRLLKTRAVPRQNFGREAKSTEIRLVSNSIVHEIHKLLRSCFTQAMKWELIERNPCTNATVPKKVSTPRNIWDAETLFKAIELCDNPLLRLAMNLSFSCSLRMGEMLALTWDCVDIAPESIQSGSAHIYVNKEVQRVKRESLDMLENKDVMLTFPTTSSNTSTVVVLKTPKTQSSIRTIYLPTTVAEMLMQWKQEQDILRETLGDEYQDYNLVFASSVGMPIEGISIRKDLKKLIEEHDLPPIVFHSLRHSSITYKLKLNGGDIKAVQGDSGHAQAKMVTDQYSHILDGDRKNNAKLFEDAFYANHGASSASGTQTVPEEAAPNTVSSATEDDQELVQKILSNPDLMTLLRTLVK